MQNESNLEAHSIKLIDDSKWTEVAEVIKDFQISLSKYVLTRTHP